VLFIGYGGGVGRAFKTLDILKGDGINAALLDMRFVKPIDKKLLKEL
jgi:1-deoxy-D-xylulose-5-phosphate synthase